MSTILTKRKEEVLRAVIHNYILTAKPVGSRIIAKRYDLGLSAATIRNVMADLEDEGYLSHPHTSAGRIPTSNGYRIYVDNLMKIERLDSVIKKKIRDNVDTLDKDVDFLLAKTSQILGSVSKQLGVVIGPSLDNAIFDKMSLMSVSTGRVLIVLTLKNGIIKSIVVEIKSNLDPRDLELTCQVMNSRLSGLTIKNIKKTIGERLHDIVYANKEIIRLFVDSPHKFFRFDNEKIFVGGTKNIVEQPEFLPHDKLKSIIELVEEKDMIVHLLKSAKNNDRTVVMIGDDDKTELKNSFSIVSTQYTVGDEVGLLGIIGPVRMWYPKMVPLVDYTAEIINKVLK